MKNITIILLALLVSNSWAQPPAIEWDKTYGSLNYDMPHGGAIQTADGGFLVSGLSYSGASIDKSSSEGGLDYWVIRLDQNGNKLWDRTFGGSSDDYLTAAVEADDGGFILGGYSASAISGNKSASSQGGHDYWLVKIDASGNKIWDRSIGSPTTDILVSMASMSGGRYALAGYSGQGAGGDKSSYRGGNDYWVVVIDGNGHVVWERVYGGSSDDYLQRISVTTDGGLIMAGYSISSTSFEKTEPARSSSFDYWVVKTDGSGNKQWDRTLGGTSSDIAFTIIQAPDGGYLVGGYSNSPAGYEKTTSPRGGLLTSSYCSDPCGWSGCCGYTSYSYYNADYWVVKLNSSGSKMWDMIYGTAQHEDLRNIDVLYDGFLLTGHSPGSASYDKSENSRGGNDNWLIKIDASGNRVWDKTIGGNSTEHVSGSCTAITDDGGIVLTSISYSGVSGEKSEGVKGASDYWIVKFEPIEDIEPPAFQTMPADITASIEPGTCAAVVTWTAPTVSDNVGVISLVSSHAPGSTFPFGQTEVIYTATDAAGNTATASFIVNVVDNEAPVPLIAELPVLSGECNLEVTSTPLALDNCSAEISGETVDPLSYTEQGTYTITWTYDDGNGNVFSQKQAIIVKDVTAPVITELADITQPVDKGLCGAVVMFTEPGADDNCGLKSFARVDDVPYNSGDVFPEGTFEIIYEAIDVGDNVTVMSFQISIFNEAPEITSVSTSLDPHAVGTSVPVAVAFNDENVVSGEITWGDGATTPGTLGDGSFAAEHVYTAPGVYTLGIRVVDACGLEASTLYQYVVVYDPDGGFVTGGGWFHSPEGAYIADPQATGKATFGFVSRYKSGATVPTGNTDFQFHAAGLKFNSTSYEWLVVAGHKAMYKGTGIFNGAADHGFLISAVDGAKTSSGDPDKFRIKIWDPTGAVVYDNQNGDAEDAEATTVIGGGSIVIHAEKSKTSSSSGRMYVAAEESVQLGERTNSAYPNPFKDRITVEFHSTVESEVDIHLLDVAGQSVYERSFTFNTQGLYEVDLTSRALARKIYFLKVTQGRRVEFLKVVRE